jgi:iron-sulfur cluster repair protein YtfE (RIC family)
MKSNHILKNKHITWCCNGNCCILMLNHTHSKELKIKELFKTLTVLQIKCVHTY